MDRKFHISRFHVKKLNCQILPCRTGLSHTCLHTITSATIFLINSKHLRYCSLFKDTAFLFTDQLRPKKKKGKK